MKEYTVYHYNKYTNTDITLTVEATSSETALAQVSGCAAFSFTRKNQNAESEADRDNAHTQDAKGFIGYAAYRRGREEQYKA